MFYEDPQGFDELLEIVHGIDTKNNHPDELFPFFLQYIYDQNPTLKYKKVTMSYTDLTVPEEWYPDARQMTRSIIYHSGPTNSGKTHSALTKFFDAKSGIYCGPLKLLAHEILAKAKSKVILTGSKYILRS